MSDRQREDIDAGGDTTIRHNQHICSAGVIPGRREREEIEGYLSLKDVAQKTNISIKHIRNHLGEITYYRFSKRGKIWLRWSDVIDWMERHRIELQRDDDLLSILRDLKAKGNR